MQHTADAFEDVKINARGVQTERPSEAIGNVVNKGCDLGRVTRELQQGWRSQVVDVTQSVTQVLSHLEADRQLVVLDLNSGTLF